MPALVKRVGVVLVVLAGTVFRLLLLLLAVAVAVIDLVDFWPQTQGTVGKVLDGCLLLLAVGFAVAVLVGAVRRVRRADEQRPVSRVNARR